jgi:hypothetical protein
MMRKRKRNQTDGEKKKWNRNQADGDIGITGDESER